MDPQPHAPSYWVATAGPEPDGPRPLVGDRTVEAAVVGGGYTGLAAAHRLAGTHGLDTVVLEAHRVGWGASGRNGGFALLTMGKVPLGERIRKWGMDAARRSIERGVEAVETVRELIARESIACDAQPDGWLLVAHRADHVADLEERVRIYREVLGYRGAEFVPAERLARRFQRRGPDRLDRGGLELEILLVGERRVVDPPEAEVERAERGQQQREGDAAVGDDPEDRPQGLVEEVVLRPVVGDQRAVGADADQRAARRHADRIVARVAEEDEREGDPADAHK